MPTLNISLQTPTGYGLQNGRTAALELAFPTRVDVDDVSIRTTALVAVDETPLEIPTAVDLATTVDLATAVGVVADVGGVGMGTATAVGRNAWLLDVVALALTGLCVCLCVCVCVCAYVYYTKRFVCEYVH
jgi:hypothetical protein